MKKQVILNLYQQERDKRSQELFNKNENELSPEEVIKLNKYIYDLNNPIWKKIVLDGKETNYEISNTGQVRNSLTCNILKASKGSNGYFHVCIRLIENKYRKIYTKSNHRLVAEAFIPNPENKPQVNHINGIKTCNWIGNLEWVTPSENGKHAFANNLSKPNKGIESVLSIYTDKQIHDVCKLLEEGKNLCGEIAKMCEVDLGTVYAIKSGKRWKHISSQYKINFISRKHRPNSEALQVRDLLLKGKSTKDIMKEMGYISNSANSSYISFQRKKLYETSTTIESLQCSRNTTSM